MKKTVLVFFFDIWMFPFYLEHEVGKVEEAGIALIKGYSLKFRQTRDNGYAKAEIRFSDDSNEIIWGALYRISLSQFSLLLKKFKKDFDLEFCTAAVSKDGKTIVVQRPFLTDTLPNYNTVPMEWYKKIMIAGARCFDLPSAYQNELAAIVAKEDHWLSRARQMLDFLNYPVLIQKDLSEAHLRVAQQNKNRSYVALLNDHAFDGCNFDVQKQGNEYQFKTITQIRPGVQTNRELKLAKQTLILNHGKNKIYIPGKNFIVTNIAYDEHNSKHLRGSFSCFSTLPPDELNGHYCRMIIPIDGKIGLRRDFQIMSYLENGRLHNGLIKLEILGKEIHFYQQKMNEVEYLMIDALDKLPLKRFLETVHAIQLIYALLKGDYLSSEARVFFYDDPMMRQVVGSYFHTMRDPIHGLPGVFTTNGYFGINNDEEARGDDDKVMEEEHAKARIEIHKISFDIFSRLCNEVISSEKVLRSLIILVTTQNITLESRIPSQYVALEALTAIFVKGSNKELKPIKDDRIAEKLVVFMTEALQQFSKEQGFTAEQDLKLEPLRRKLLNFNEPPNEDKLSKSFEVLNYKPNPEEKKVIKLRNKFLHGSTVEVDFDSNEDYGYKELFHISLRLHMLLAIMLLKKAGYSGKIVNYVKLYAQNIEMDVKEERFREI